MLLLFRNVALFLQIIQTIIEQTLYHFTYLPTLIKNLIENVHFLYHQ